MSLLPQPETSSLPEIPIAPCAEDWLALSRRERDAFLDAAREALDAHAALMPEERGHARTLDRISSLLGDHVQRIGRRLYLASDLLVVYPGQRLFAPDLIAVLDVEDPGDQDTRTSWSVTEEGRGVDLALEVLVAGDRQKDLVANVAFYARLGIPEYIVYDRRRQRLYGYRLSPATGRYDSVAPSGGRLWSRVLGLDLGIVGERLRFFHGDGAEVPETIELVTRANALVDELERRAEAAEAERAETQRRAEAAEAERSALLARIAELEALLKSR